MATKTIETKAIISAQDKTGATFSAVAAKLKGLEGAAASASRRMDAVSRGMSSIGQKRAFHESISARMSSVSPVTSGLGGRYAAVTATAAAVGAGIKQNAIQAGIVAGATAVAAAPVIRRIVEASIARETERISQSVAGLTGDEMRLVREGGEKVSARHKSLSATESEGMLRDLRTVVGTVENAVKISDEVAKLRIILKRSNPDAPGAELDSQIGEIVRAADQVGATSDKAKFGAFVDDFAKMQNAFGSVITPQSYREFIQSTRGAASGYSRDFLSGVAPSLIQTMGPESGVALQSLHSAVVGGTMEKSAKLELAKLGLIDRKGKVIGRDVAQKNPLEWVQNFLVKRMNAKGVTGEAAQGEMIDSLFSDRTARQAAKLLAFNAPQIARDAAATGKAKGLAAADEIERRDLKTATASVTAQFTNLGAVLGQSVTPRLTDLANSLAQKVGGFTDAVKDDPKAQARTWIGGALAAPLVGHLGASALGGYFGGAGLGAGIAGLTATTPLLAAGIIGAGAYQAGSAVRDIWGRIPDTNQLPPQNAIERAADRFDRWAGITSYDTYRQSSDRMRGAWDALHTGGDRSGRLAFGFGEGGVGKGAAAALDPNNLMGGLMAAIKAAPAQPVRLEGAADINLKVEVEADSESVVRKVEQRIDANGALRTGTGVTMLPQ